MNFSSIPRYTLTLVACTNWRLDHIALYQSLEVIKLETDPLSGKKRSAVKLNVPNGSILQLKYKDLYKTVHVRGYGVDDSASQGCFSNSTTIVMYVGKIVVLKVPSQGKIQITGCRSEKQVYQAIHALWKAIQKVRDQFPDVARIPDNEVPKVIFNPVMNNINLHLGFNINKRKIHEFLYKDSEFHVIPNDAKYAGVTAKLEVEGFRELPLVRHRFLNNRWYESKTDWTEYLSMLSPKDRQKEVKTERYHTFLIFHSGKVIQSGPRYELMENVFNYFVDLMNKNRPRIEDKTTEAVVKKKKSTN